MKMLCALVMALVLLPVFAGGAAHAQSRPEYVKLGRANGALYRPDSGTPHVAFVVMHRVGDFMRHPACEGLSSRGFMVLCIDPTAENNESIVNWDQTMLDVKAGVEYVRKQPGITKVVLFGHSGGGSVMAAYQATAEKGLSYCRGPNKLVQCGDRLANLPAADAVVFADAHPSEGLMQMRDLNPSVTADASGALHVRADLDLYSPANGYNPAGSHYSKEFQQRYSEAQAAMIGGQIEKAQKALADMKASGITRPGEDMIVIPSTHASGWMARIDASYPDARQTIRPEKLLKNDGTISVQKIVSVATVTGPEETRRLETGAYWQTVSFLQAHAMRAKNSIGDDGVDYCSTNASSICAAGYVTVPILVAGMGGYLFVRDAERLYDHGASKDKDLIIVEGAVHNFTACTACEKTPGQYANSEKNFFNYIRDWANKRFPG